MSIPDASDSPGLGLDQLLARPHLRLTVEITRRLDASGFPGVRPAHGAVFRTIGEGGRVTDLARRAGMTKQAMTELVSHLDGGGYIERRPDPTDRRARIARLTPEGRRAMARMAEVVAEIDAEWESRIGVRRMRRIRRGLAALDRALDDETTRPDG